jgi:ubiquinone/menaquinone biosynthesis C-methylase UbiE
MDHDGAPPLRSRVVSDDRFHPVGLRLALWRFYWRAQRLLTPKLKHCQDIYEDVLFERTSGVAQWLDLGCGHCLLPPWRAARERQITARPRLLVGLDYDLPSLRKHTSIRQLVQGDISRLPFADQSFDLVTANMVFEHLADPQRQLSEIFRILAPGGSLIFHTPNLHGYGTFLARLVPQRVKGRVIEFIEGRPEEDVFLTHYRINDRSTIRRLAAGAGFEVAALRMIVSGAHFVMVPPLALIELLLIRTLMTPIGRPLRSNIIAVLTKPRATAAVAVAS